MKRSIIPPRPVYLQVEGNRKTGYFVAVFSSPAKRAADVLGSLSLPNNSDRAIAAAHREAQRMFS